jgi:hypothetical protein
MTETDNLRKEASCVSPYCSSLLVLVISLFGTVILALGQNLGLRAGATVSGGCSFHIPLPGIVAPAVLVTKCSLAYSFLFETIATPVK